MGQGAGGGAFNASLCALVGRYTYRPATDEWWWSDTMFRIHGFEPGAVVPTTALVMRHIHPEDVEAAWESREAVVGRGEAYSFLHRIVTATQAHKVVIAAGHVEDEDGTLVVSGHLVDLTDVRRDAVNAELESAVVDFVGHRAVIEQAKGVLMQLYSVDADTAWVLLRAFSVDTNRKVRDIARALVSAAADDRTPTKRQRVSAHDMLERIYAEALEGAPPG
ncbi:ANTAR domain-containing protein [Nocardioides sp. zg-1308]|uniref:PAS and ANTAR domain-containing protein n=1 Tax=Nocardioides renjunii TaxID=3095075 RepID=A0ABU5KCW5_9ACTN|nr:MULTISPECIES: PAS and ANTAR domain-containing protein [unclassified Nocardioides]MDZ5662818.1 PAS and ANTAR domain-containing protein [Nocardioides sp. S-58]NPD05513.1 ANTAR domain-containing protein [Nocardioides sp. zg-1308]WQQ23399.1 PAS and ANTAR domain-containing protein [Nocardioides sp. S-34]